MSKQWFCVLSSCFLISCSGTDDSFLKVHTSRGPGPGGGTGSQKPNEDAIKAGVFFDFTGNELGVVSANEKSVVLGARFSVNGRDAGYRRMTFPIASGEKIQVDHREFDLTPDSELKMEVYRFENPKTSQKYLAVDYRFELIKENDSGVEVRIQSRRLLLLVAVMKPKPQQIVSDFQFPRDKNLSLEKWVESKFKKD